MSWFQANSSHKRAPEGDPSSDKAILLPGGVRATTMLLSVYKPEVPGGNVRVVGRNKGWLILVAGDQAEHDQDSSGNDA